MSDRPGLALRKEKEEMLRKQAERREGERPMTDQHQLQYAQALLARLEQIRPPTPVRIVMHGPPASSADDIPERMPAALGACLPEPAGGCFADIAEDDADDTQER